MNNIPELSELQADLLGELFNIGVGQASDSLSKMVRQEILMSVPQVEFVKTDNMMNILGSENSLVGISQEIGGSLEGQSVLLFPEEGSKDVVKGMLGDHIDENMMSELYEETLTEIGNILLNACVGALAQSMNKEFAMEIPTFNSGSPHEILSSNVNDENDDIVLLIKIDMTLAESSVKGYIAFVLGEVSMETLVSYLDQMLGGVPSAMG